MAQCAALCGINRFSMKLVSSVFIAFCSILSLGAEKRQTDRPSEPEILYVFPVGGRQNSTFQIEVEGQSLDGTYAVWTDCQELRAEATRVQEAKIYIKPKRAEDGLQTGYRLILEITASPETAVGGHVLRLVSPRGISNSFPLRISPQSEAVVNEAEDQTVHGKPVRAQQVSFPVAVSGRLGRVLGGEVDYYKFQAQKGEELFFEVFFQASKGHRIDNRGKILLYLYEPAASWVDPHRLVQLAFNDDPVAHENGLFALGADSVRAALTYRFKKKGSYLIAVRAFDDRSSPDLVYQLRIVPSSEAAVVPRDNKAWPLAHANGQEWEERQFGREIDVSQLEKIWSRTVRVPKDTGDNGPESQSEGEHAEAAALQQVTERALGPLSFYRVEEKSHEVPDQAYSLNVPTLVEGAIDCPGKSNYFRLHVEAEQQVVLEVQTSDALPPVFNPWLRVLDAQGEVVFTNIYNRVEGNNVMLFRYLEPKVIYTFRDAGEYTLEIRDLTTRYGNPEFSYRLLVRPQIPHLGNFKMDVNYLNLLPGEAKNLTLTSEREEGFEGEIAYSLENLPDGVRALAGTSYVEDRPAPFDEGEKDRFRPDRQEVTIVLLADSGAPVTRMPKVARVQAQPIVKGQPGAPMFVGEISMMVVQLPRTEEADRRSLAD